MYAVDASTREVGIMKKVSNNRDSYKINDNVTVNVVNKRNEDMASGDVHYERTVTIKIKAGKFATEPLIFNQASSLSEFIEQVNFEDPQEELPLDD